MDQWIGAYAQNVQGAKLNDYLWHTFSFGIYPSVCEREAELLFTQQIATEFVVLSNDRRSALLTDALPTKCNMMDYLVFPTDLAWSVAFTHEDGWFGHYFAKHPNYEASLERARAQQRKAQVIERG